MHTSEINSSMAAVLATLQGYPADMRFAVTSKALERLTGLSRATIWRATDNLQTLGLITGRVLKFPRHRRAVYWYLPGSVADAAQDAVHELADAGELFAIADNAEGTPVL